MKKPVQTSPEESEKKSDFSDDLSAGVNSAGFSEHLGFVGLAIEFVIAGFIALASARKRKRVAKEATDGN